MSNVKVTAEGMAALLHVARGRNTVDRWCDIAIEWMRQADAALSAHDNNANVSVQANLASTLNAHGGPLNELQRESESLGLYDPPIPWVPCSMRQPVGPGEYLCYEPHIGPPPDFVFLRWDGDRGWRDNGDNKGFPTHWLRLEPPPSPVPIAMIGLDSL
jgi:hypothetical protein